MGLMVLDRFSLYAPIYDGFVWMAGVSPVQALVAESDVKAGERVLDLGGGTGRVALALAERGARVTVLDPCWAMLKRAPRHPSVERIQARAQALPLADESFDLVLCIDALHHIKEAEAALREAHRVLRPGGRLYVRDFDVRSWRGRAVRLFEHLLVDDSRFLAPESLSELAQRLGFKGSTRTCSWLEYVYAGEK
ncbi:MAG: methyltransferase domain-containing protein [Firmicutes bacterium]|nr:methyltransferase domain-containing protein [Bacillota bacterium]